MTGHEFVERLSSLPVLYQPGVWDYGFGLDLLGLVIEQISGDSLGRYLESHLWGPLGMVDTGFALPPDKANRRANPLPVDPISGQPQSVRQTSLKFECGGGCALSTASDYMRFAAMLMNKGRYGNTRILGRKTVEYMLANQLGPDVKKLGW